MLKEIMIEGYKSIDKENLTLAPLTILTGTNSSGKSSVIQAFLLLARFAITANRYSLDKITLPYSNVREVRNKFTNTQEIKISMPIEGHDVIDSLSLLVSEKDEGIRFRGGVKPTDEFLKKQIKPDWFNTSEPPSILSYENLDNYNEPELFYLSASRVGPQDIAPIGDSKVGAMAEFLFGHFDKVKGKQLAEDLTFFDGSDTLGYQVSQWLSKITMTDSELKTEKVSSVEVKVSFTSDGLENVSASNLGAGMSYVAKIIILCLIAKKGDLVIIENPEIHLHPKAQAQLGVFFTFIANSGIQLLIETHCEHLINKVCYQIYDETFSCDNLVIHYSRNARTPFELIRVNESGFYVNKEGENISFPSGFFDESVRDLLEMRS